MTLLSLWDLLRSLPAGAKVLDLGCGAGTFDYSCFPQLEIHALDERIDEKVKSFPSHVLFQVGDAAAIPEQDSSFAVVVANFVFEHFPDAAASLREIDRVTQDGGYVWISTNNAGSFEDKLYRNLLAGGGHLQHPTFERFLRQTYENTSLKMLAYMEIPPGFTFLGESEELRHLTWAIVDALKRTVGLDARPRSSYGFVLQKLSSVGPGFREYVRCCFKCGSPDETLAAEGAQEPTSNSWACSKCGEPNCHPSGLQEISLDDVGRGLRLQWERYPEIHPQRLRELIEEKVRWGRDLERMLDESRENYARLKSEFDERGRWAAEIDNQIQAQREELRRGRELERMLDESRENYARLKSEFDERGRWAGELDKEIHAQREYIEELKEEARLPMERLARLLRQLWRRIWGVTR